MTDTVLAFDHVSKRYFFDHAVDDITFHLPAGRIIGLIGANGSGKTTILKLAAGLLRPTQGSVTVLGQRANRRLCGQVAYVSDQPDLYSFYTVAEMARFFERVYPDFDAGRASGILRFLELNPGTRIRALSKGNWGRLKMALALARRAPLILMDEPLAGLDPVVRHSIVKSLIAFIDLERQTVVMSTHEVKEVEPMLDTAVLVHRGRVRAVRQVEDVQSQGLGLVDWMVEEMSGDSGSDTDGLS